MDIVVSHWSASPLVLSGCAAVAIVHLRGTHAAAADARRHGRALPPGTVLQAGVFYLGMLTVLLALVSPVGYWAQRYIWIRSAQDVLLAMIAPSLIVLGAPWSMLARAFGRVERADAAGTARLDGRLDGRLSRAWPIAVTVAFGVAWWGWHAPALYDAALRHPAVYAAEVICYLGLGIASWLQLVGSGPLRPRLPPLRRAALAVATLAWTTVLAIVLVFGSWLLYPAYAGSEHRTLSVVADQQIGGAVLWTLALLPYFIVAVALLLRWLSEEGSEDLMTGLERMLKPKTSAWPSRPGLR